MGCGTWIVDSTVVSLNVTISIVLQLGETIAGVATSIAETTDIGSISDAAGDFVLPVMEDPTAVEDNILMFKIIASILILVQVLAVSFIATRLLAALIHKYPRTDDSVAMDCTIASPSFLVLLDGASSMFNIHENRILCNRYPKHAEPMDYSVLETSMADFFSSVVLTTELIIASLLMISGFRMMREGWIQQRKSI